MDSTKIFSNSIIGMSGFNKATIRRQRSVKVGFSCTLQTGPVLKLTLNPYGPVKHFIALEGQKYLFFDKP